MVADFHDVTENFICSPERVKYLISVVANYGVVWLGKLVASRLRTPGSAAGIDTCKLLQNFDDKHS